MRLRFYMKFMLLSFYFVLHLSNSCAQTVMGRPLLFEYPTEYINQETMNKFINEKHKKSKDSPWIVLSDRNQNKTYKKPNEESEVMAVLNFGDCMVVVSEKNEWVRLNSGEFNRSSFKIENGKVTDLGWIKKSNLLLWRYPLTKERANSYKKIFVSYGINDLQLQTDQTLPDLNICLEGPFPSSPIRILDKDIFNNRVLYAYKEENEKILVGKEWWSCNASENIYGWVSKEKVTMWNNMIAATLSHKRKDERLLLSYEDPVHKNWNYEINSSLFHTDLKGHLIVGNERQGSTLKSIFIPFVPSVLSKLIRIEGLKKLNKTRDYSERKLLYENLKEDYWVKSYTYNAITDLKYFEPALVISGQKLQNLSDIYLNFEKKRIEKDSVKHMEKTIEYLYNSFNPIFSGTSTNKIEYDKLSIAEIFNINLAFYDWLKTHGIDINSNGLDTFHHTILPFLKDSNELENTYKGYAKDQNERIMTLTEIWSIN